MPECENHWKPRQVKLQELVIPSGRAGYVLSYRFAHEEDSVDVLAIRHQREGGFVE